MPKKKTTTLTPEVKQAVLLLRYHKKKPVKSDPTFMSYSAIANHLDLPCNSVRYICTRIYLQRRRQPKRASPERRIEAE